jgi:hypothetical protein
MKTNEHLPTTHKYIYLASASCFVDVANAVPTAIGKDITANMPTISAVPLPTVVPTHASRLYTAPP